MIHVLACWASRLSHDLLCVHLSLLDFSRKLWTYWANPKAQKHSTDCPLSPKLSFCFVFKSLAANETIVAGCFSLMGFTCLCTQTLSSSQAWCLPVAADLTHLFFPSISRSCLGGYTGSLSPHEVYTPSSKNRVMKVERKSQLSGNFSHWICFGS